MGMGRLLLLVTYKICLKSAGLYDFFCVFWLVFVLFCFFFFKQKTAYEIVSRDWSSDVCSSDLESWNLFHYIYGQAILGTACSLAEAA